MAILEQLRSLPSCVRIVANSHIYAQKTSHFSLSKKWEAVHMRGVFEFGVSEIKGYME